MEKLSLDPFGWKNKENEGLSYGDPKLVAMTSFINSGDFGKIEYEPTRDVEAKFSEAIEYDPSNYDAKKVLTKLSEIADEKDRKFFSKPYADNVVMVLEKAYGVPDAVAIGYVYCESEAGDANMSISVQGKKMTEISGDRKTNNSARMPFSFLGYKGIDDNWHIFIPKFENNFDKDDVELFNERSKKKIPTQYAGVDIEIDDQCGYLKEWMQKRIYDNEHSIFDCLTAADGTLLPITNYGHIEKRPVKKISQGVFSVGRFVFDGKLSRLITSGTPLSDCSDTDFRVRMPRGFIESLPDESAFDLLSMIDYNKNAKIIHSQLSQDSDYILIDL